LDFKGKTKEEAVREIREFIQKEIDLIEREELSSEAFSKAAWPYYSQKLLGLIIKHLTWVVRKD